MTVLLALQVGAVVAAYHYRGKLRDAIVKKGEELKDHYIDNPDFQAAIDEIQRGWKCCGITVSSIIP